MLDLEKKIFTALEYGRLNEFKDAISHADNLSHNDICSMFNICMLEIDTKKAFATFMFNTFGDAFKATENKRLLDSFSNYWNREARHFYTELLQNKQATKKNTSYKDTLNTNYDVEFLRKIKDVRNKISKLFGNNFDSFNDKRRKIIFDVFTFLTFKCKTCDDVLNFSNNAFISRLNLCGSYQLSVELNNTAIDFKNVLASSIRTLHLEDYVPFDYLDKLLTNPNLLANKDACVALNIFLLRGKFNWVPLSNSSFGYYLENSKDFDFSNSNPLINCWEAILYTMYKSNIVDLNTLKNLYLCGEIDNNVAKFFDYPNAIPISLANWRDLLKDSTNLLLGDAFDVQKGINHVMLSVPFSQKQLLKMLITERFDEKPCNVKLYSHWNKYTNNTLDSVSKKDFDKLVCDNLVFRARDINTL